MGAAGSTPETPIEEIPLTLEDVYQPSKFKPKYGWKRDMPDHRDIYHSFSDNSLHSLPIDIDLRKYMPPVYNQGELGSCTANAIAGAFQFDEMKQYRQKLLDMRKQDDIATEKKIFDKWSGILSEPKPVTRSMSKKRKKKKRNKVVEAVVEQNKEILEQPVMIFETPKKPVMFTPSRLFIYYNERDMEGTVSTDSGAEIRDGMKSINSVGVCREVDWPYDISKFTEKPPESCYKEAEGLKSKKYVRANTDLDHLKGYLQSGFPVIFGFVVFESFESDEVAKTGKMPMPQSDETRLGGHAVLMCGYDDKQNCFIVRNSWGDEWGDNGYFYMPYEFVSTPGYCDDFWVLYSITESNEKLLFSDKDNKRQTTMDDFLVNPCLKKVTLKLEV